MRVLVTGHHGYIGSVLAPLLAEAGHDVVGLDTRLLPRLRLRAREPRRFPARAPTSATSTPAELEGFDAIVHLAALSNDPLGDLDPGLTEDINRDGTLRLARAARDAGVRRFIFASSCSMYGASGTDDALDEGAPAAADDRRTPSRRFARRRGCSSSPDRTSRRSRCGTRTVFGASPRLRLDIVLNNLAAWAHTTGRIRLLSDGTAWRPLVHVRDVAKTALALLDAPEDDDPRRGVQRRHRRAELPRPRARRGPRAGHAAARSRSPRARPPTNRSYRVDFSKLARAFPELVLDWNAERGARELVDAYRRGRADAGGLRGRPLRPAAAARVTARPRRTRLPAPLARTARCVTGRSSAASCASPTRRALPHAPRGERHAGDRGWRTRRRSAHTRLRLST